MTLLQDFSVIVSEFPLVTLIYLDGHMALKPGNAMFLPILTPIITCQYFLEHFLLLSIRSISFKVYVKEIWFFFKVDGEG